MNHNSLLLLLINLHLITASQYLLGPDFSANEATKITFETDGEISACTVTFPALPLPDLKDYVETFINGNLVICGGKVGDSFYSNFCFEFKSGEWVDFAPMVHARGSAESVWLDETHWMVGGGAGT